MWQNVVGGHTLSCNFNASYWDRRGSLMLEEVFVWYSLYMQCILLYTVGYIPRHYLLKRCNYYSSAISVTLIMSAGKVTLFPFFCRGLSVSCKRKDLASCFSILHCQKVVPQHSLHSWALVLCQRFLFQLPHLFLECNHWV